MISVSRLRTPVESRSVTLSSRSSQISSRPSLRSRLTELCLAVAARLAFRRRSSARAGSWFQHQEEPIIAGSVQGSPLRFVPAQTALTAHLLPWGYRGARPSRLASAPIYASSSIQKCRSCPDLLSGRTSTPHLSCDAHDTRDTVTPTPVPPRHHHSRPRGTPSSG